MNEYEIASLGVARTTAWASVFAALATAFAAVGIWIFGIGMNRNHIESMTALTELIRRTAPPSSLPSQGGPGPSR